MRLVSQIGAGSIVIFVLAGFISRAIAGKVYVTNYLTPDVSVVSSGGGVATPFVAGTGAAEGIVIGPNGLIYTANQVTGVVNAIDAHGTVTPFAMVPTNGGQQGLAGLAVDAGGNLYVSVQKGNAVDKISAAGVASTYATGVGNPQGLAFDPAGNLFVADLANNRIDKIPVGGGPVTVFATMTDVHGIATDASGDVFATSNSGGYVEKFSPAGGDIGRYGSVTYPVGLGFDETGTLLVASQLNDIYAIAPGGGTATVYATGLNDPLYLAVAIPEPTSAGLALTAVVGTATLSRTRRRRFDAHPLTISKL